MKKLQETESSSVVYDWQYILKIAGDHRKELLQANIIAILATMASVPVPLLLPLLVDEVLMNQPGVVVATINSFTPVVWHGPILYISTILILTVMLRFIALVFNVWQTRQFTIGSALLQSSNKKFAKNDLRQE